MQPEIADLKDLVDFRQLVLETHDVDPSGKTICPAHDDHDPSLQVYEDHAYCFACGWHADHITWLELVHNLTTREAIQELRRRAGEVPMAPRKPPGGRRPRRQQVVHHPCCKALTIPEKALQRHLARVARLNRIPPTLRGRGFTLEDLRALMIAEEHGDAILAITDPHYQVVALKRRKSRPVGKEKRYTYSDTPGHGTPAWCSPGFLEASEALVIEGELNAMICWLVRPDLGVMGVAGAESHLHLEALKGKTIFVYADPDEAGNPARQRWAREAHDAGAKQVFVLEPWEADACDIAGCRGREALREKLS